MSGGLLAGIANTLIDGIGDKTINLDGSDEDVVAFLRDAVAIRSAADHLIAMAAVHVERTGIAKRSGMKVREVLGANGIAPAVASRDLRIGRAIEVLPTVTRHSRTGTVAAEYLDAVARGIDHVATRTKQPVGSEAIGALEQQLIARAIAGNTPSEIVEHARSMAIEMNAQVGTLDDETPDQLPPAEDATLNELDWSKSDDGRLRGAFDLDALTAERLITALDTASRPRPEPDGSDDPRSATLRRADAFGQLLECGTRGLSPDAFSGPARTEVILTIPVGAAGDGEFGDTAARLGWMGPISDFTAKLAACNASMTGIGMDINGVPLDVSATQRLFTGAVRKATHARDRCCVKCGGPASWCDVHHIKLDVDGGLTVLDNGCLLCRSCHTAVHHGGRDVVMGADRHPWLIPPASVDPQRGPLPAYNRRTMRLDDPVAA